MTATVEKVTRILKPAPILALLVCGELKITFGTLLLWKLTDDVVNGIELTR